VADEILGEWVAARRSLGGGTGAAPVAGSFAVTINIVKGDDGVYVGQIVELGDGYKRTGKHLVKDDGYVRFHLLPDETRANGVPTFKTERRQPWDRESPWSPGRGPSLLNAKKGLIHGGEYWMRKR
jgi:hypothetical protein